MAKDAAFEFVRPDPAKRNLVIFAGAGVSVGAGLPTMLSFSHAVRTCSSLSVEEKLDFDRIQIACSPFTALTGASSRNLEDLASFLSVMKLSRPSFSFAGCNGRHTPETALQLLMKCIAQVCSPANHGYRCTVGRLIDQTVPSANVTMVTTNYDMNIELSAYALGVVPQVSPWIHEKAASGTVEAPSTDTMSLYGCTGRTDTNAGESYLRLFKLHGSVNWRQCKGGLSVEDRVRLEDPRSPNSPTSYRLDHLGNDLGEDDQPLIVPPAIIKSDRLEPLAEEWKGTSEAIEQADALWFIGYSFPPTDAFMRHFLSGAIHANTRLRQVVILDPKAWEIAARAKKLFGSPELRGLVEPIPLVWEKMVPYFHQLIQREWKPNLSVHPELKELNNERAGLAVLQGSSIQAESPRLGGIRFRGG